MPTATESITYLRVPVSSAVVDHFEALSILNDSTPEDEIAKHLARTKDQTSDVAPIYLNDRQATELRSLLGGRISNVSALIAIIRRMCSWKAGGHEFSLPPSVLEQIAAYARTSDKPIAQIAPELLANAVRSFFKA